MNENKKTILFIHGILVGGWCWDKYKKFFEERGYRCVAPNLRYHGIGQNEEPNPRLGSTSLVDYVDDLEKEIHELNLPNGEKPIVIGHSMGALLAQKLAERGLAEKIVLISSAPPSDIIQPLFWLVKGFFLLKTPYLFWKKPNTVTFKNFKNMVLHRIATDEQEQIFEKIGYESGRALLEISFGFLDPYKASNIDDKKVYCPVLVLSGDEDRVLSTKITKKIAQKYNTKYKVFTHHAHWIIAEPNWEEVAEYIAEWLQVQK
jgi:non-heme chloroperoxidase